MPKILTPRRESQRKEPRGINFSMRYVYVPQRLPPKLGATIYNDRMGMVGPRPDCIGIQGVKAGPHQ